MRVGFTGTKAGMTDVQKQLVEQMLRTLKPSVAIHGDCVGADEQFHAMCQKLDIPIEIMPCNIRSQRAYCKGAVKVHKEENPIARNHTIVDSVHTMIATPKEIGEVLRSGTWATIRYAWRISRKIIIFYPLREEGGES